jgi:uncharacterized protein
MNGLRTMIMFFTTVSVTFYIFTLITLTLLSVVLDKKISFKTSFGYSAIIFAAFFILLSAGRGLNIGFLEHLGYYLSVLILYLFFLSLLILPFYYGFHLKPAIVTSILSLTIILAFGYGIWNANGLKIKEISITSPKVSKPYKFVQISDVHLGTESLSYLDEIVEKINGISPDGVFITGDFLDDSRLKPEDIKGLSKLNFPAYFITGNHERYSRYTDEFFKECRVVKVLDHFGRQDDFNDEITVFGIEWNRRDMMNRKSEQIVFFDSIKVDPSKFNIFLNHEPALVEEAGSEGMDLMLSGHTHNGQIFPFNLFVRMRYRHIYGLYDIGKMKLYVTSGTGVWGPFMRVGSDNEIVIINVVPKK